MHFLSETVMIGPQAHHLTLVIGRQCAQGGGMRGTRIGDRFLMGAGKTLQLGLVIGRYLGQRTLMIKTELGDGGVVFGANLVQLRVVVRFGRAQPRFEVRTQGGEGGVIIRSGRHKAVLEFGDAAPVGIDLSGQTLPFGSAGGRCDLGFIELLGDRSQRRVTLGQRGGRGRVGKGQRRELLDLGVAFQQQLGVFGLDGVEFGRSSAEIASRTRGRRALRGTGGCAVRRSTEPIDIGRRRRTRT